jgi:hypothetical protein
MLDHRVSNFVSPPIAQQRSRLSGGFSAKPGSRVAPSVEMRASRSYNELLVNLPFCHTV